MKRSLSIIALLLAAVLTVMCFAACNNSKSSSSSKSDSSASDVSEPEETEAPTLVGSYKVIGGTELDEETLESIKDKTELVINDDLTGTLSVGERSMKVSFDEAAKTATTEGGATADYEFDGKTLTLTMDSGLTEIYEKK